MGTGIKLKKSKRKISFDQEIITKTDAKSTLPKLVQSDEIGTLVNSSQSRLKKQKRKIEEKASIKRKKKAIIEQIQSEAVDNIDTRKKSKNIKNKRKRDASQSIADDIDNNGEKKETSIQTKRKKRRKLKQPTTHELKARSQYNVQEELNPIQPTINTMDSLRKKKKKRHTELVDAKRLQTELNLQQKALNYLSKWKHSKDQWKFEKLTQIWIQNSLYDNTKLPDNIWSTVVDYFNLANGKVRHDILNNAIKLYEKENTNENSNAVILNRAKSIVQCLNE